MIELKNIPLEGVSIGQQLDKVIEEDYEFIEAVDFDMDERTIEEFWDSVQAKLGLLHLTRGITAEDVMKQYPKHLEKIKDRPRMK